MLKIGRITLGMYMTNCYFIHNEGSNEAIVIDPADSGDYINQKLAENGLKTAAILLTHGHFDHIYGVDALRKATGCQVYGSGDEQLLLKDPDINSSVMVGRPVTVNLDRKLKGGDELDIAGIKLSVIATPGHTVGSVCYYVESEGVLFAGDTMFQESVGRTDLPTGSSSQLIDSINDKIMCLPDETKVYPGHGEFTTIGHERDYNPFAVGL